MDAAMTHSTRGNGDDARVRRIALAWKTVGLADVLRAAAQSCPARESVPVLNGFSLAGVIARLGERRDLV